MVSDPWLIIKYPFVFLDRKGLFHYETNTTSNGRWYFYLDENWQDTATETNCTKKIAMSRFSGRMFKLQQIFILFMSYKTTFLHLGFLNQFLPVGIHNIEGQQFVNQWSRPHFWYVVYADPNTCLLETPTEDIFIGYTLKFLNPDSHGIANDHFGEDEKGIYNIYVIYNSLC